MMAGISVLHKGDTGTDIMDKHKVSAIAEDLQSPQRSITDFFKSPPSVQKSKNLTQFFSNIPNNRVNQDILTQKCNTTVITVLDSPTVEKNTKKEKTKKSLQTQKHTVSVNNNILQNGEDDIQRKEFEAPAVVCDELNISAISKRVKLKKKKKKNLEDSLDEQFIQHFDSIHVKSDTSADDINASPSEKLASNYCPILINNNEKAVLINDLSVMSVENDVSRKMKLKEKETPESVEEQSTVKRKRNVDSDLTKIQTKRTKLSQKSADSQTNSKDSIEDSKKSHKNSHFTDSSKCPLKSKKSLKYTDIHQDLNSSPKTSTKSTKAQEMCGSKEVAKDSCTSISYEDYLKGLDDKELENEDDLKIEEMAEEPLIVENENYPSITQYFRKSSKSENSETSMKDTSLTITVDIHPQPDYKPVYHLFTKKTNNIKNKTKDRSGLSPNSSCVSVCEDEIILLSSEIQEVEEDIKKDKSKSSDTSVEVISSPVPKQQKVTSKECEAFLKGDQKVEGPSKTAQATLAFTKNGIKMDKKNIVTETVPAPLPVLETVPKEISTDKEVKRKTKKSTSKSKKADKTQNSSVEESILGKVEQNEDIIHKKAKRKYKVTSLQFDDSKKTPIKMKIKCRRSLGNTSNEENEFTPRSTKHSAKKDSAKKLLVKAQEILVKAKKKKAKSKKKDKHNPKTPEVSKFTSRRSSPRLASKPNISLEEVIDLDDEDDDDDDADVKIVSENVPKQKLKKHCGTSLKTKKLPGTPVKTHKKPATPGKTGTLKNGTMKLASIFNSGKTKGETIEPKLVKTPEDPEKVRLRHAFLSSNMPDEVKKQTAVTSTECALPEYSPLPRITHTQQIDTGNIPSNKPLNIKFSTPSYFTHCDVKWIDLQLSKLYKEPTSTEHATCILKNFKHHKSPSNDVCLNLLEDIKQSNSSYQFNQMFDSLKTKKLEELKIINSEGSQSDKMCDVVECEVITIGDEGDDEDVKTKKKKKLKRKKFKSATELKPDITRKTEEPQIFSELLWTDRYQPSHSSDILGNTGNITKLKTWLLEWKHKTHKDARKMKKLLSKQTKKNTSLLYLIAKIQ